MKLQPWKPLEELDRFFDDDNWGFMFPTRLMQDMALDIYEKDGNLVAEADVVGINPEDLDISIENNTLIIQGETRAEEEEKKKKYYRKERSYGKVYRAIGLPRAVKENEIKANYKNGKLTVSIPLAEEAKAKKVKVEVKK